MYLEDRGDVREPIGHDPIFIVTRGGAKGHHSPSIIFKNAAQAIGTLEIKFSEYACFFKFEGQGTLGTSGGGASMVS